MSAVVAIAHVLSVRMKSLSVSIMLLEYSFGKLKYDSTTLPMSGFFGSSSVSASKSPVSPAKSPSIAYRVSNRDWKPE